jgi:hypothetical protein
MLELKMVEGCVEFENSPRYPKRPMSMSVKSRRVGNLLFDEQQDVAKQWVTSKTESTAPIFLIMGY